MKIGEIDELVGKYCRVISKVPDEEEAFYNFGTIKYVNNEHGFLLVDTKRGLKRFGIDDVFDVMPIEEYVSKKF